MKNSISILFFLVVLVTNAQIAFVGQPEPVDKLNSPNGQNYLVLDPHSNKMAFTEERAGGGDKSDLADYVNYVDSLGVYFFYNWLGMKRKVSALGFDGNDILYNHVFYNQGIYYGLVMRLRESGKERVPVIIPFFRNKSSEQSGCISNDGQFMILSAESNHTYGVEDLYVSERNADGSWTSIKNLGSIINSEFQEVTPFLAADNRTLFFASNRPGGQGSFDIYYSVRLDDFWRNWTEPKPLGGPINSPGSETSFTFRDDEEWAYFVRSQNSDSYGDILRIRLKEDIQEDTTQALRPEPEIVAESPEGDRVVLKVVDANTKEAIPAELIIGEKRRVEASGIFEIDPLPVREVEIKSQGYLPKMVTLDEQLKKGELVIELSSVAKGNVITLDHVLFHRGTANMIEGSEKELDLLVEMMRDNPKIKILLKGHTDNTGDPVRNVQLSEARVKAVKEYLVNQGISPYRITGKGYGGNQPIASNETEETRKLNRRVEFEVIED